MGRNSWRRMTSYRGSRKRKLPHQGMGHGFGMFEECKGDVMELTEDEINSEITPENQLWKMDGFGVVEALDIVTASKDVISSDSGGGKKTDITEAENCSSVESGSILSGIPLRASSREPRPGVIFVFEKASLVLAKVNKSYHIINPDEHAGFIKNITWTEVITGLTSFMRLVATPYFKEFLGNNWFQTSNAGQCNSMDYLQHVLVRLLGSRLNLAGGIQAVYVKTIQGHLIKIESSLCVPRTLKGFCAMMSQLFQKLSIKGSGRSKCRKLLQIIQNPVAIHLPVGSHKIGLSSTSSKAVNLWEYFDTLVDDRPLVFVIGAMAHGKIGSEHTDDFISVSGLPLSASICVRRICNAFERQWMIV